jgi:hypothetical protein
LLIFFLWAFNATTPKECKVPIERMSANCKALIYSR